MTGNVSFARVKSKFTTGHDSSHGTGAVHWSMTHQRLCQFDLQFLDHHQGDICTVHHQWGWCQWKRQVLGVGIHVHVWVISVKDPASFGGSVNVCGMKNGDSLDWCRCQQMTIANLRCVCQCAVNHHTSIILSVRVQTAEQICAPLAKNPRSCL